MEKGMWFSFFNKLDYGSMLLSTPWTITLIEHQRSASLKDRIISDTISPIWSLLEVSRSSAQFSCRQPKESLYLLVHPDGQQGAEVAPFQQHSTALLLRPCCISNKWIFF
jgi:hypothetical protein